MIIKQNYYQLKLLSFSIEIYELSINSNYCKLILSLIKIIDKNGH